MALAFGTDGTASIPGRVLLHAGTMGPLLATLIMLAPASQREIRARWWRRLSTLRSLASPAGALCVLLPVVIMQLALDSYALAGGILLPAPRVGDALALLLPTLLLGALPQELAWRGYALPALLGQRRVLGPTLVVAAAWGAWQLPLFFIPGTYQAGIALGSIEGLLFFAGLFGQSLLMTAFYLATRCTWAAVLFHWITLLAGEAWELPVAAEGHRALWTLLIAAVLVLVRQPFGLQGSDAETRQ